MDAHEPTHGDAWQAAEDARQQQQTRDAQTFRAEIRQALADVKADSRAECWVANAIADACRATRDERDE